MIFYGLHKRWLDYKEKHKAEEDEIVRRRDALKRSRDNRRHKLETSKLVLWFMLFLLLSIMLFTGYVTIRMMTISETVGQGMDFTPLVALISAIVGQVIITLGYFAKATKENSKDGITYLNAQHQFNENHQFDDNLYNESPQIDDNDIEGVG